MVEQAHAHASGALHHVFPVLLRKGSPRDVQMQPGPILNELPDKQAGSYGPRIPSAYIAQVGVGCLVLFPVLGEGRQPQTLSPLFAEASSSR